MLDVVEFFDNMFKCALTYGMSSAEFWFGDPQDYFVYQDAFVDKIKVQHDDDDIKAWMFGQYNLLAYRQVMSEVWGKKGSSKKIFPDKPNVLTKQQETAKTEIDSPHPLMGKFMRMARAVNNKFKE